MKYLVIVESVVDSQIIGVCVVEVKDQIDSGAPVHEHSESRVLVPGDDVFG